MSMDAKEIEALVRSSRDKAKNWSHRKLNPDKWLFTSSAITRQWLLVCLKDPTVYCRLHRYEGQMLYLQVGRYGIYCFVAAMCVTAVLAGLFSHDWGVLCPEWLQTANAASPVCFAVNTDFMGALSQVGQDFDIAGRNFSQVGVFLALSGLLTFVMPDLGAFLLSGFSSGNWAPVKKKKLWPICWVSL